MALLRHVDRIRVPNLYFKEHRRLFLNYEQSISVMKMFLFSHIVDPGEPDPLAQLIIRPTADPGSHV